MESVKSCSDYAKYDLTSALVIKSEDSKLCSACK